MANKKNELTEVDFLVDEDCEYEHDAHCGEDEAIVNNMLGHVFTGANHQMLTAVELTKLIIDKTPSMNAEQIFNTYKQALNVVAESTPILSLLSLVGAEIA